MKKLIIFAGAMLLLAIGTVEFFANRPMNAQEALILRNVEAIARQEIGGGGTIWAWTSDTYYHDTTEGGFYPCPNKIDEVMWVSFDVIYEITNCIGMGFTRCTPEQRLFSKSIGWSNGC